MIQYKSVNQKISINELMLIEIVMVVIINLISMFLAYLLLGVDGVGEIVKSMDGQFKLSSLIPAGINVIIALFLWVFFKRFNSRYRNVEFKRMLRLISEGLLDTLIAIFRLAGGVLISFSILYLFVEHYENFIILFITYGLISLFNSTFLVFMKQMMFLKPDRELKRRNF